MKIAYVCNEYPPALHGGIGTFVSSIAHGMLAAGHQVSVVGWGKNPGERDDSGVRVVTLPESTCRGMAWWINRRRVCRWVQREARAGNVEIVESPEFQGPLITRPGRTPVVLRLHLSATAIGRHGKRPVSGLTGYCEKRCLSLFRSWIAVSKYALELTRNTFLIQPREFKTVYSPIAPANERSQPFPDLPSLFVLYAGGAVSRRKGAYVLAEAATQFLRTHTDLRLVFIGPLVSEEGVSADDRIRGIVGADLASRVVFCGRVSRDTLLKSMRQAAVFVYPSTLETFGLVTAEAMMQGCPVIACETGPSPELLSNGQTGLLVPPNSPESIAQAVTRLLTDRASANQIARAGQSMVRSRFTLQRCVNETLAFYEDCLSRSRRVARIPAN